MQVNEWQVEAARQAQQRHNDFVLASKTQCEESQKAVADLVQRIRNECGVPSNMLLNLDSGQFEEPPAPPMDAAQTLARMQAPAAVPEPEPETLGPPQVATPPSTPAPNPNPPAEPHQ